jgi:hypothetical protein
MTGIEPPGATSLPPQFTPVGLTEVQGDTVEFQVSWTT